VAFLPGVQLLDLVRVPCAGTGGVQGRASEKS
jgi:hypothetical protein